MFDDFADDLVKAEVATKGNWLRAGSGVVVITDVREDTDRSGKKAVIDLLILKATPKAGKEAEVNTAGERVSKQYRFEDGKPNKRAAVKAAFKRDLCSFAGKDGRSITPEAFKALLNEAKELKGVLAGYDSYDTANDAGEGRTYHNFTALKQDAAGIMKRRKLLDEGADTGAFL